MIVCYINAQAAYPSTTSSIKVTFENAAIKERESRTQELTFNLDIPDNRKVFGAVNRIDVKKSATTFETCRLYADNLLVIEGTGTITSYSDTEVKLQIKTATAASQFPASFSSLYIDRITDFLTQSEIEFDKLLADNDGFCFNESITDQPLIPIYDEANARWLNCPCFYEGNNQKTIEHYAPQPLLKDVVARIVYALGYKEKGGSQNIFTLFSPIAFFEQYPWSKLHVLNTNPSIRYRNMLPHWTAEKFFTELANLFNLRFIFDEKTMTVTVSEGSVVGSDEAHYECLDEFSSDYDEDGESLLAASNLSYNVGDSENWTYETLSQEIVAQFDIVDCDDPFTKADSMSEQEKLTSIFRTKKELGYFFHEYDDDGNAINSNWLAGVCLGNLIRQPKSDETFELNIVPACMAYLEVEVKLYTELKGAKGDSIPYQIVAKGTAFVPTTAESKTMITDGTATYVTVENAVNGDDTDKTDEQERMEIFFVDDDKAAQVEITTNAKGTFDIYDCHTYCTDRGCTKTYDSTLALCDTETKYSIGKLHSQAAKVDNHDTIVIKFEADDLPDPRRTYVFRNKRFLCDKIELEITADGISKVKTGYFFEMQ